MLVHVSGEEVTVIRRSLNEIKVAAEILDKMVSQAVATVGSGPFLGVSNLGPYGHFEGVGNRYGEVTTSVLVFSKD